MSTFAVIEHPYVLLGKSLTVAIDSIPDLLYKTTDSEGRKVYTDEGASSDSLYVFFLTVENNNVVEICQYKESNDAMAYRWFVWNIETFLEKKEFESLKSPSSLSNLFFFHDYSVQVSYIDENIRGKSYVIYKPLTTANQ